MDKIQEQILELVKKENPSNPLSYVQNIVKDFAIEKLNAGIKECKDCIINENCTKSIFSGNPNASILIIGESPASKQDSPTPLLDEEGSKVIISLGKCGANVDEIAFINTVNCFPNKDGEARIATVNEIKNCRYFLDYAIEVVNPLLIIAIGGIALNSLNEEMGKQGIGNARGKYFNYRGIKVMPTYHPNVITKLESNSISASVVKSMKWDLYNDIDKAITDIHNEYPNLNLKLELENGDDNNG